MNTSALIPGFLRNPEKNANNEIYTGRLCCDDVQITGNDSEAIATFTITVRQLLGAAASQMLWTDQDVQRGVRPEITTKVKRELSLADGYPDQDIYIFSAKSADEMTEKLLGGQRLFINPLVWNMRPGSFEAYYDRDNRKIYIYDGKIYLPDSHHRHQAILNAAKAFKEAPNDYPHFDLDKQFKVEMYFLKREDEGNYFFDKNQRTTPTAKSKAYDLTTEDILSVLAKKVIDITPSLQRNVNRVTDRLTGKNPNVVTLSTLRESLRGIANFDQIDETEIEGIAQIVSSFFEVLHSYRTEVGHLNLSERKQVRSNSLVDAPIMFQGYGSLITDFSIDVPKLGLSSTKKLWAKKLALLSPSIEYFEGDWKGDLFAKENPMWFRLGILKPGTSSQPNVINNRASRSQVAKALRAIVEQSNSEKDLASIVQR